jgi:hypothetical protein
MPELCESIKIYRMFYYNLGLSWGLKVSLKLGITCFYFLFLINEETHEKATHSWLWAKSGSFSNNSVFIKKSA